MILSYICYHLLDKVVLNFLIVLLDFLWKNINLIKIYIPIFNSNICDGSPDNSIELRNSNVNSKAEFSSAKVSTDL